ncbi:MAG: two-component regulator propeller domain-containing protein [Spirochaetaceae bacterium]
MKKRFRRFAIGKNRILRRRALFFALLSVWSGVSIPPAEGQQFFEAGQVPRFNPISRAEGLPSNAVSSIQQDGRGFMWFGTQGGLAKYDGRKFEYYRNIPFEEDSLPHDLVQTLYYHEEEDTLWVGTYRGLARHRIGEAGFTTFSHDTEDPSSLSNDVVIAIDRDDEGTLWIGTQDGLNRMVSEGVFERVDTVSEVIRDLFVDRSGTLWVGGYGGLERWDPRSKRLEKADIDLPSDYVMAIEELRPGVLLLACWGGGLVEYHTKTGMTETRAFADDRLYAVRAGSDGTLWAGSWGGGLFAVAPDGTEYHFSDADDSLASPVIYSIHQDKAGLIWIGTNGGGLYRLSPRQRNYRAFHHDPERPGSLPPGKINAVHRGADRTLWVGTYGGGLARYDEATRRWVTYRHEPEDPYSLANDIVTGISEDSQGNLWILSNGGLQRFDPERGTFLRWGVHVYPEAPLTGEIIYAFTEDREGNYWIGSYRHGVERYDRESGTLVRYSNDPEDPATLSNNLVYDLLEDSEGTVWVATNGGLNRYRPETDDFQRFLYDPDDLTGPSGNTIRVLYEDTKQRLWIGTVSGGLNRFVRETETFVHLTAKDGLSNNTILGILEGADGRLWLSSQQGISSYNPETGMIDVLDERDGLYGSEFNNGHHQDPDGTLYFGGSHGVTRINSAIGGVNFHVPEVQITDVTVFQESLDPYRPTFNGAEITLSPSENFVGFEFVGIDYESPHSNQYAYKLAGFDEDWVLAGTRNYATYTNLPPGRYRLMVRAANADAVWSTEPAELVLRVEAPWYVTWWAVVGYALILVLLFRGILKLREAHVLSAKNRALEESNSKLAQANAELGRLSIRDSLTGAFNRRYFDGKLTEEWHRARRSGDWIALLMADVDYFKLYNDTHGHIAGDSCLISVSQIMERQLVRTTDAVARYGGEEFAILLYGTDLPGGLAVAERLRKAVESQNHEVTISIGVAAMQPAKGQSALDLVAAADRGLYQAKHTGRNRVTADRVRI